MKVPFVAVVAALASCAGCSESGPDRDDSSVAVNSDVTSGNSELKLRDGQVELEHREFAAREEKLIFVETDVPIMIGFRTRVSEEQKAMIQPSPNPMFKSMDEVAVKIVEASMPAGKKPTYVGNNTGAGMTFLPRDGKVQVTVTNHCNCPLTILVYRMDCTAEEIQQLKDGASH